MTRKLTEWIGWHDQTNPVLVACPGDIDATRVESGLTYEPDAKSCVLPFSGLYDLAELLGIDEDPETVELTKDEFKALIETMMTA